MTSVRGRIALSRCSSPSTEGGTTTRVPSAYGTRTASPWPPSLGPPQRSPCTHELGKPSRQNSQVPSDIKKGAITRATFLMVSAFAHLYSTIVLYSSSLSSLVYRLYVVRVATQTGT